jgi:hypothetical protein
VLFGWARSASHSLSSASVRAVAVAVWSPTGRRAGVEPVLVVRFLRVRVLLDMTPSIRRRSWSLIGCGWSCPGRGGCGPRCAAGVRATPLWTLPSPVKSSRVAKIRCLSRVDSCLLVWPVAVVGGDKTGRWWALSDTHHGADICRHLPWPIPANYGDRSQMPSPLTRRLPRLWPRNTKAHLTFLGARSVDRAVNTTENTDSQVSSVRDSILDKLGKRVSDRRYCDIGPHAGE